MAIHRKAKLATNSDAAAAFMTGAPDAAAAAPKQPYEKGLPKGNKRQISLTIAPELLRQVDERAEKMGTGRAAFISMAIYKALENN